MLSKLSIPRHCLVLTTWTSHNASVVFWHCREQWTVEVTNRQIQKYDFFTIFTHPKNPNFRFTISGFLAAIKLVDKSG